MKLAIQFLNAVVELLIMVLLPEIVMSKENVFKMLALSQQAKGAQVKFSGFCMTGSSQLTPLGQVKLIKVISTQLREQKSLKPFPCFSSQCSKLIQKVQINKYLTLIQIENHLFIHCNATYLVHIVYYDNTKIDDYGSVALL